MSDLCPFCKMYPYHEVDVGVGYVKAAVDCCDLGVALFQYQSKEAIKTLRLMRSRSPRHKARAMKILRDHGLRPLSKREQRTCNPEGKK